MFTSLCDEDDCGVQDMSSTERKMSVYVTDKRTLKKFQDLSSFF